MGTSTDRYRVWRKITPYFPMLIYSRSYFCVHPVVLQNIYYYAQRCNNSKTK